MVASASMSFRTPTASLTFHYTYNASLAYENPLVYEPTVTNGSASYRLKPAAAITNRPVTSATMKGR